MVKSFARLCLSILARESNWSLWTRVSTGINVRGTTEWFGLQCDFETLADTTA